MTFLLPTEFWVCTLSWAFSVVRGLSWWMLSSAAVKSAGRSQTFTVQSRLPDTTKEAFILNKHTQVEVYFSVDVEDVASEDCKTSYGTWSRRWSPQHWCGCSPGPHSAHGRCPCTTHRLTCPTSKEATHLLDLFIEHMLRYGAETGLQTSQSPSFPYSLLLFLLFVCSAVVV